MILRNLLISFFVGIVAFLCFQTEVNAQNEQNLLEGDVVRIIESETVVQDDFTYDIQTLEIKVTKGLYVGRTIQVENNTVSKVQNPVLYSVGDSLVIMHSIDWEGNDLFFITDFVRRGSLLILFALFVFLSILIGGVWGLASLVGMGISFAVILLYILPQIINGANPIMVAIVGSMFIIPVTFYLSHGFSKKTHVAVVGTLVALFITGMLALYFVTLTHLTGYSSEEASFLSYQQPGLINMQGLLLAGIIIGTLGILDDITISQASIVSELVLANNKMSQYEIFTRAMRVGRDHISSLINTLFLVYTGASLPLLLLFYGNNASFYDLINIELIADEVVRTLVGSMGLILAVPITTLLASYAFRCRST